MADQIPGLFDLPPGAVVTPPEPEPLTHGQRRARLIAQRITAGLHPLGYVGLHREAARARTGPGLRCGSCRFRQREQHHNRVYPKCQHGGGIRVTGCEASDIRAWWPACRDYEPKENEGA